MNPRGRVTLVPHPPTCLGVPAAINDHSQPALPGRLQRGKPTAFSLPSHHHGREWLFAYPLWHWWVPLQAWALLRARDVPTCPLSTCTHVSRTNLRQCGGHSTPTPRPVSSSSCLPISLNSGSIHTAAEAKSQRCLLSSLSHPL